MRLTLLILRIRPSTFRTPLGQRSRQVRNRQQRTSVWILARSLLQQRITQLLIRLSLIRFEVQILPRQASVVLNRIWSMFIELREVECVIEIALSHEIGCELGHIEAEAWCKVEGLLDLHFELAERDILAVMWDDAMVCHCIYHGA